MGKSHSTPDSSELRRKVLSHFDGLAADYDGYKSDASYYYEQLKLLLQSLLPGARDQRILEIGCGTGQLLAELAPRQGLGIDISGKMIEIAREHWAARPELIFRTGEAETLALSEPWDAVVMSDVIEHLYDPAAAFRALSRSVPPGTRLVLTWANHSWTWILHLLEFLHMKMPEGPHHWAPLDQVRRQLAASGFRVESHGTRCMVPARLPLADRINRQFHRWPLIRSWGLIRFVTAVREDTGTDA